jgi:hypothetical protein
VLGEPLRDGALLIAVPIAYDHRIPHDVLQATHPAGVCQCIRGAEQASVVVVSQILSIRQYRALCSKSMSQS